MECVVALGGKGNDAWWQGLVPLPTALEWLGAKGWLPLVAGCETLGDGIRIPWWWDVNPLVARERMGGGWGRLAWCQGVGYHLGCWLTPGTRGGIRPR